MWLGELNIVVAAAAAEFDPASVVREFVQAGRRRSRVRPGLSRSDECASRHPG